MSTVDHNTEIYSEEKNGNLHIRLHGHFGVDTAMQLTSLMSRQYRGAGNIFIHTAQITDVSPQSKTMFESMLGVFNLPRRKIYLTGEKGFAFCHQNGRVIVPRVTAKNKGIGGCGCAGKCTASCKSCTCNRPKS